MGATTATACATACIAGPRPSRPPTRSSRQPSPERHRVPRARGGRPRRRSLAGRSRASSRRSMILSSIASRERTSGRSARPWPTRSAASASYGWFTRWWLSPAARRGPARTIRLGRGRAGLRARCRRARAPRPRARSPRSAAGSMMSSTSGRYACAGLDDSSTRAHRPRWAGMPVDIDFRLGRWASHIREHTDPGRQDA